MNSTQNCSSFSSNIYECTEQNCMAQKRWLISALGSYNPTNQRVCLAQQPVPPTAGGLCYDHDKSNKSDSGHCLPGLTSELISSPFSNIRVWGPVEEGKLNTSRGHTEGLWVFSVVRVKRNFLTWSLWGFHSEQKHTQKPT